MGLIINQRINHGTRSCEIFVASYHLLLHRVADTTMALIEQLHKLYPLVHL